MNIIIIVRLLRLQLNAASYIQEQTQGKHVKRTHETNCAIAVEIIMKVTQQCKDKMLPSDAGDT